MQNNKTNIYDYIVVGGGIAGCSVAYELSKSTQNLLLIDKNSDISQEASKAAGAFLSPLLGKPNYFKTLVNKALIYSTNLYKTKFANLIQDCGTIRIPKDDIDEKKFRSYIPFMEFDFTKDDKTKGYKFDVGSVVNSYEICNSMTKNIQKLLSCNITNIKYEDDLWILNDNYKTKHLILTTGYDTSLLIEDYLKIRPVWGRRIDIKTSTKVLCNYHKNCSVSKTINDIVSIGATHHRDKKDLLDIKKDAAELLLKASEIIELKDIEVLDSYIGARASSFDYLPLLGSVINQKETLVKYPYLINGTKVPNELFSRYNNLSILNGVGGRGFVLSPYLAKLLVDDIISNQPFDDKLKPDRLFIKNIKRKR